MDYGYHVCSQITSLYIFYQYRECCSRDYTLWDFNNSELLLIYYSYKNRTFEHLNASSAPGGTRTTFSLLCCIQPFSTIYTCHETFYFKNYWWLRIWAIFEGTHSKLYGAVYNLLKAPNSIGRCHWLEVIHTIIPILLHVLLKIEIKHGAWRIVVSVEGRCTVRSVLMWVMKLMGLHRSASHNIAAQVLLALILDRSARFYWMWHPAFFLLSYYLREENVTFTYFEVTNISEVQIFFMKWTPESQNKSLLWYYSY